VKRNCTPPFSALARGWAVPAAPRHDKLRLLRWCCSEDGSGVVSSCLGHRLFVSAVEAIQALQFSGTKSFLAHVDPFTGL
jgi:hypothetical protein